MTKPAITSLVVFTCACAMIVASRALPRADLLLGTLIGGALASGGASALNHVLEIDSDALMRRTRSRPLPARRLSPAAAFAYGSALVCVGTALVFVFANALAAALTLSAALFYVVVYTRWLKRTTAQNIVIGGAAGAFPPLIGWAAVTGSVGMPGVLFFALVFFWTPAHFWPLALLLERDYAEAGIPMLPVVAGIDATRRAIVIYAATLPGVGVLLALSAGLGLAFTADAVLLGIAFVGVTVWLRGAPAAELRRRSRITYLVSLAYLGLFFALAAISAL